MSCVLCPVVLGFCHSKMRSLATVVDEIANWYCIHLSIRQDHRVAVIWASFNGEQHITRFGACRFKAISQVGDRLTGLFDEGAGADVTSSPAACAASRNFARASA